MSTTRRKFSLPLPGLRWRGFTLQLFLLTILPLTILLLAITFGSISLHHEAMRSLVGDRDLRAVRAASTSLSEQLNHRADTIQLLASRLDGKTSLKDLLTAIPGLTDDFEGGLAILSTNGELVGATSGSPIPNMDPKILTAIAVQSSIPSKNSVFSAPFQAPPGQGLYWVMALHRTMDGNLLAGLFSPASLARQSLSGAVDPAQSTVVLSAPGGVTLFQAGPLVGSGLLVNPPGIVNALNGESGIDYLHSSAGEHVVAFSPVSPLGWGLMFEETWENIASPLLSTTQATPLILAPLLVLALVALGFGARQIVQPLQALQGETAELARGNFEAIEKPVGGINEIRMLQNDLAAMARELQAAQDSLRGYIGAITAGVENERLNLARELHDDTLQTLIALQQRIHLASLAGENLQPLVDVQQTVQSTITNLRQMLRGLRPIYLEDLGLNAALGMLVSENAVAGGTEITYTCTGEERRLAPEIELALYRMAQEAVSNIYRHATARHAWVALTYLENRVILEIRDDGRGFIVPDTTAGFARGGHFGLLGLHERAEIIAASLQIHSQPGQGAVVRIEKSGGFLPE